MTITKASFRTSYPAFAGTASFPDAAVDLYIGLAYRLLSADRWGDLLDYGAGLFVEHFLTLDRISAAGAAGGLGGIAGTAVGVLTGGTVDKVTYSKDVASVMEEGAGHWGMTVYGGVFLRLARMMGAGPVQVGLPSPADCAGLYSGAWPGPYQGPW